MDDNKYNCIWGYSLIEIDKEKLNKDIAELDAKFKECLKEINKPIIVKLWDRIKNFFTTG